jgi:hypothetical protein
VKQCRDRFAASLAGLPVTMESGPTVSSLGKITTVQLEAQPKDPNIIDPKLYVCDFQNGELISAAPR